MYLIALGYTILHTLACLVPFLEHELMDTLPYLVASTMTLFPCSLHKDIIDVLCNHLLPFTFRKYALLRVILSTFICF